MADLMSKLVLGIIGITVAVYVLSNAFVPAISGADFSNVGGQDLGWVVGILALLVVIGLAYAGYKHFLGNQ